MSSSASYAENAGMSESPNFPLRVVDGLTLPPEYRKALRPGEDWKDSTGRPRQLPRYFYEIPSWDMAMKIELASHFLLWENQYESLFRASREWLQNGTYNGQQNGKFSVDTKGQIQREP